MDAELARSMRHLLPTTGEPSAEHLADTLWIARLIGSADSASSPWDVGASSALGRPASPAPSSSPTSGFSGGEALPLYAASTVDPPGADDAPDPSSGRAAGRPAAVVRMSGESALTDPLALSRALRPLKQPASSRGRPVLDEEATAHAIGETSLLLPSLLTRTERYFTIDLVIDTGQSMTMWHRLATELRALLESHGAFRVVRTWSLDTSAAEPRLSVFRGARETSSGRFVPPERITDPTGRSLRLLLTDGVGPLWHGTGLTAVLDRWSRTGPVAILQVLPQSLWHRTAIAPEPALAGAARQRGRGPLIKSAAPSHRVEQPSLPGGWVPVLQLEADWIAPWARLVAGSTTGWQPVMAVRVDGARGLAGAADPGPDPMPGSREPQDARALVERFHGEASAAAFELSGYLAAVPLVLPVIRLVQRVMMPDSGTAHLAEVLLSGLVIPSSDNTGPSADPELTLYDFRPGVRQALLDTLTRRESLRVLDVVSRISGKVASRLGGTLDFRALLPTAHTSGTWRLPEGSRPFAHVAATVLAGLGGEHAEAAAVLMSGAQAGAVAAESGSGRDPKGVPQNGVEADPAFGDTPRDPAARDVLVHEEGTAQELESPVTGGSEPEPEQRRSLRDVLRARRPRRPVPGETVEETDQATPHVPSRQTARVYFDADDFPQDPAEILVPLVSAATVRIHGPEPGSPFRGSGFFIAPNWVLTCAHVALTGREESMGAARRVSVGYGDEVLSGVVEWAEPDVRPGLDTARWPAPDLALVRLLDHVEHPCVWITERTAKSYTTNQVAFFGWTTMDAGPGGAVYEYNGRCTISGQLGAGSGGMLRLSDSDEMPYGVSGGPVVDLVRGEVIGVLKSRRRGQDGGLAVGIQQLRRLPVAKAPQDDLYHRVMTAHDLHHADHYRFVPDNEVTWTDAHAEIGATAGRALTPGRRTQLLGLLAQLPPPPGARALQDIITEVRGSPVQGIPLAPRAWRDGLGLLYDLRRGTMELEAVLRYAVHAATADRPQPADEAAERDLWRWAQDIAAGSDSLTRMFRNTLMMERRTRLRTRDAAALERRPAYQARTETLLEIIPRGWEPGRYDWRVSVMVPGGEAHTVEEDLRGTTLDVLQGRLAEALAEAFRRCDEPGYPAALQLAVPTDLVSLPVDTWRLSPGAPPLGAERPVVVRRNDASSDEDPAITIEREDRWRAQHLRRLTPLVLDGEAERVEIPSEDELRALPSETVPVLCHSASAAPRMLRDLAAAGFPVVLWRREPLRAEETAECLRGIERTVRRAGTAAGLPAAVTALRADVADGVPEAYWSTGLTLLYDDPTQLLPSRQG